MESKYRLSVRELAALRALVAGEKVQATAARLGLSGGTLRTYRRRALNKLNVTSSLQAAMLVVREDELDATPPLLLVEV